MKQAIVILVLLAVGSVLAYYHVANQSYYPVSKLASADGYTFHMVQDRRAQRNACGEANERVLAPIKARILLMLTLTRSSDAREIQRMLSEY